MTPFLNLVEAMRPAHWSKNLLVFAGLFLGGRMADGAAWSNATLAFVALSFAASAGYLVNDVRDAASDASHALKRSRPIPSGRLSRRTALAAAPILALASLIVAASANGGVLVVTAAYLALTFAYTLVLKRLRWADVAALGALFTLRVLAGTAAAGVVASPWLIAFSVAFFLSLALSKRADELAAARADARVPGRAYAASDMATVRAAGLALLAAATALLAIYVVEPGYDPAHYPHGVWLWGFPVFVAVFLSRVWALALKGHLQGDAAIAAWRDPVTLAAGAGLALSFARATGLI